MEDYVTVYPKSEEEQKLWSLFGYKQNFKGLGIFFSNFDNSNKVTRPTGRLAHISLCVCISISLSLSPCSGTRPYLLPTATAPRTTSSHKTCQPRVTTHIHTHTHTRTAARSPVPTCHSLASLFHI